MDGAAAQPGGSDGTPDDAGEVVTPTGPFPVGIATSWPSSVSGGNTPA